MTAWTLPRWGQADQEDELSRSSRKRGDKRVVERGGKAEQEVCIAKTWQTWRCRWPSWQERGTGGELEEGGGVVTTAATAINQSPMFANDIIHF